MTCMNRHSTFTPSQQESTKSLSQFWTPWQVSSNDIRHLKLPGIATPFKWSEFKFINPNYKYNPNPNVTHTFIPSLIQAPDKKKHDAVVFKKETQRNETKHTRDKNPVKLSSSVYNSKVNLHAFRVDVAATALRCTELTLPRWCAKWSKAKIADFQCFWWPHIPTVMGWWWNWELKENAHISRAGKYPTLIRLENPTMSNLAFLKCFFEMFFFVCALKQKGEKYCTWKQEINVDVGISLEDQFCFEMASHRSVTSGLKVHPTICSLEVSGKIWLLSWKCFIWIWLCRFKILSNTSWTKLAKKCIKPTVHQI